MHAYLEVGLAICIVGCAAFGLNLALRKHGRRFTPGTEKEYDAAGEGVCAYPEGVFSPQIPIRDLAMIYLESRSSRRAVLLEILQHPTADGSICLDMVCEKHATIRKLVVANLNERFIGILGLGLPAVSPRVLLRTYGEEQEVVSHLYKD
jgi:hypothetical protein